MSDYSLLIDGKMVPGDSTMPVLNPATEEVVAQCPRASKDQLDKAVAAAKAAYPAWAATPMEERRKLIIVPREAPYATVHLENMAKLSQWGTIVIPASPGFYNHPKNIDDMVDFIIARILDQLGYEHDIGRRWTGDEV